MGAWTRWIDHGLGVLLVVLTVRFLRVLASEEWALSVFMACFAWTVVAIRLCSWAAGHIGVSLSRWRNREDLPKECRDPLSNPVNLKKWKDQSWQLWIHFVMSAYEVFLLKDLNWWQEPLVIYEPCAEVQEHSLELRTFYILQLSVWMWTAFSCKWLEERRKDYLEMMLHHVVTVALVSDSYVSGQLRVGLLVLAVHDISDVFLDIMKMANYLKVEGPSGLFITEIAFVINTYITWPYLRFYKFVIVTYNVIVPGAAMCPNSTQYLQSLGLIVLLCLHAHWWMILQRIALKIIRGGDPSKAGDEEYEVVEAERARPSKKKAQ